jgi:hypothetical protein
MRLTGISPHRLMNTQACNLALLVDIIVRIMKRLMRSSGYNGISKTSSRGEFFIPHLSLSLDTLVTGIRINGMALFYRGGAQPFPGLSLWVGHRLFYLFLGINDFNTIPLMHAISYGLGSDNRYFKLEAGAVLNPIYPSAKKT